MMGGLDGEGAGRRDTPMHVGGKRDVGVGQTREWGPCSARSADRRYDLTSRYEKGRWWWSRVFRQLGLQASEEPGVAYWSE